MLKLGELKIVESKEALRDIPEGKVLINTINAHSFNVAQKEMLRAKSQPKERIAGWDLFAFEMDRLEGRSEKEEGRSKREDGRWKKVMFMGSSEKVLAMIRERAAVDYPHLEVVTYSPPYKTEFSDDDNAAIIKAINDADPDLLWIGMTAPKQEKWTYQHWKELDIHCHVGTIGAVFDFYAGTAQRAPQWWQRHSLEWLYRLIKEPRRMWRRYVIGNPLFLWNIIKEKARSSCARCQSHRM